jgi:hypothetical protein
MGCENCDKDLSTYSREHKSYTRYKHKGADNFFILTMKAAFVAAILRFIPVVVTNSC